MIYLDNSATTMPLPEVVEKEKEVLSFNWGNPSSLHHLGVEAEKQLNQSRAQVAFSLGVSPDEIYFSSSGTMASNLAIGGTCLAKKRQGLEIVTTAVEHSATWNTVQAWKEQGYTVTVIKPKLNAEGFVDQMVEAITDKTILVTMIHVHNETGTIFPIEEVARRCKEKNANLSIHVDGVQSFLKVPISLKKSNIDLFSASGHKINGPKGVGFLFIRKGTKIKPIFFGGGQEKGYFPGTENIPHIAGLGKAVEFLSSDIEQELKLAAKKNLYLRNSLSKIKEIDIISPKDGLPYIVSFAFPGILSENLLHFLEARKIYVSSGSACAKGKHSRSLAAFELNKKQLDSFIRVSFNRFTQLEEFDALATALEEAKELIQRKR